MCCRRGLLLAAILMAPACALATEAGAQTPEAPAATAPPAPSAVTTEYRRKLAAYMQTRQKFDDEAGAYWSAIAQKRRLRNAKRRDGQDLVLDDYILTQPPVYAGPPPPSPRPQTGEGAAPEIPAPPRKYIPVVADFIKSAQEYFAFVPQRPRSEIEFKRAYAKLALAAGLTRQQIVRVYAVETRRESGLCAP